MYKTFKRLIDIIASIAGILVLSPLLIVLTIVIKSDSRGPILFKQKRIGLHKNTFMIYKFRTMRTDTPADMPTHLLADPASFITKSGAFMRRTSLDELPQLFNILFGQMSVVGPRPALWNQYDLIAARDEVHANDLRPGLTGWAQINGRDELAIEVKAKLDGDYVKQMSLWFDIQIFFKTIFSVLRREGVKEGSDFDNHQ